MGSTGWSTRQIRKVLIHHDISVGGRVVAFFHVGAVTCCELDNGYLVGGQVIGPPPHEVEIVLARQADLPIEFREDRKSGPLGMELLLVGRKFRGAIGHKKNGNVSFDFGRYRLLIDRVRCGLAIEIGTDRRDFNDLPEDEYLPVADQFRIALEVGQRNHPVV